MDRLGPAIASWPSQSWSSRRHSSRRSAKTRFLWRKRLPRQSRKGLCARRSALPRRGGRDHVADEPVVDSDRDDVGALGCQQVVGERVVGGVMREEEDRAGYRHRLGGDAAVVEPRRGGRERLWRLR